MANEKKHFCESPFNKLTICRENWVCEEQDYGLLVFDQYNDNISIFMAKYCPFCGFKMEH